MNRDTLKQIMIDQDERLLEMTADDLNTILEIGLEISGTDNKPYLFLDEIQNVYGWEKFVRRIADMKYRINIAGSNSQMLTSEIASTLGGRFVIMNVYPYSFAEYLIANGKDKDYAEFITKPLSFSRLTNIIKSAGTSLGKQAVINYVSYMTDSYLLFTLSNYASKLVDKEASPKYYFMDTGLLGLMLLDCKSAQLENLVAIELIRRYGVENVFFFQNNVEIDFYVPSECLPFR